MTFLHINNKKFNWWIIHYKEEIIEMPLNFKDVVLCISNNVNSLRDVPPHGFMSYEEGSYLQEKRLAAKFPSRSSAIYKILDHLFSQTTMNRGSFSFAYHLIVSNGELNNENSGEHFFDLTRRNSIVRIARPEKNIFECTWASRLKTTYTLIMDEPMSQDAVSTFFD